MKWYSVVGVVVVKSEREGDRRKKKKEVEWVEMETGAIGGSFSVALSRARDETLAKGVLRTGGRYPPPCPAVLGLSSESPVKASSGRLSVLNGGIVCGGGEVVEG